jgi:hypothetical protein
VGEILLESDFKQLKPNRKEIESNRPKICVSYRIREEICATLARCAANERRSVSNLLAILTEWSLVELQKKGSAEALLRRVSKRRLAVYSFLLLVLLTFLIVSRKYIWLYVTRKLVPAPASADLLRDPKSSQNPETMLAEANRLAWVFNWPKAQPLCVRAEELFREKGDTRNETYARVGGAHM